jgi:hypothetical protein
MMSHDIQFQIKRQAFDEHYAPPSSTRLTTNFANLARGERRQQNLRNALAMMNSRFNALAHWDNPQGNRYQLELEIISIELLMGDHSVPSIEVLHSRILDQQTDSRIDGVVGNNFSSYLRDYDFSVRLLEHNKDQDQFSVPNDFGDLHGKLFQKFIHSDAYKQAFNKLPVICLSVSDNKIYQRTHNQHPILGIEYHANESSLTEQYFKKMGLNVRYFMPEHSVAPLAFYFFGDLLNDYSNLELISTISTMETFQKIYRPEIYNAHIAAGACYQPNLANSQHSLTPIVYDRDERSRLAKAQGLFAEEHLIKPYKTQLERWSASVNTAPSNAPTATALHTRHSGVRA